MFGDNLHTFPNHLQGYNKWMINKDFGEEYQFEYKYHLLTHCFNTIIQKHGKYYVK